MKISPILRRAGDLLFFRCPGCNSSHAIRAKSISDDESVGPSWDWNEDAERPTFSPSVLVTYNGADAGVNGAPPAVCHSFVRDGRIEFLADCTHGLAGQTVPLPPWADGEPA